MHGTNNIEYKGKWFRNKRTSVEQQARAVPERRGQRGNVINSHITDQPANVTSPITRTCKRQ